MKIRLIGVCLLLVFSSLVCNLPATLPQSTAPTPLSTATPIIILNTEPAPQAAVEDPILEELDLAYNQDLEPTINELLLDEDIIEFTSSDKDQDGRLDYFEYGFPVPKIDDHLYAWPSLVYERVQGDTFSSSFQVEFTNLADYSRQFSYLVEIPKEFAGHVDEVTFSSPPAEIIQADPIVRVEFTIGPLSSRNSPSGDSMVARFPVRSDTAGIGDQNHGDDYRIAFIVTKQTTEILLDDPFAVGVVRAKAFKILKDICDKQKDAEGRGRCYLNLVEDFGDLMEDSEKKGYCDKIGGVEQVLCRAVASQSFNACFEIDERAERDLCRAYLIANLCASSSPDDRSACTMRLAIQERSVLACLSIDDQALENSCLAQILNDPAYCERITEPGVREACLEKMRQQGLIAPKEQPPEAFQPSTLIFEGPEAVSYCNQIGKTGILDDGFGIDRAHASEKLMECAYHRSRESVHESINVVVIVFANSADARTDWDKNWGPVSNWGTDLKNRQKNGQAVTIEYSAANVFATEVETVDTIRYEKATVSQLSGSVIIIYRDVLEHKNSGYLLTTLANTQNLLKELNQP